MKASSDVNTNCHHSIKHSEIHFRQQETKRSLERVCAESECFGLTVGQILIKVDQFNIDSGTDEANTATETVCGTSKFVGWIGGVLKTNIYVSFANIIYVFGSCFHFLKCT